MDQANALTIASIHATILAISIAAIGIMVSLLGDKRLSVLQEIIEKQRKLDETVPRKYPILLLFNQRDAQYNTENEDVRGKVITSIVLVARGETSCNPPECPTLADQGRAVTAGLAALVSHYPFSSLRTYGPDGPKDGPLLREQSITSYKKWLMDMESSLLALRELQNYRGRLLHAVQAAYQGGRGPVQEAIESRKRDVAEIEEKIRGLPETDSNRDKLQIQKEGLEATLRDYQSTAPDYKELVAMILNWFKYASIEMEKFIPIRHVLEYYSAMSSSWLRPIVFTSISLTFVFGILLPMLHRFLGQYDGNWLPYIVYVVIPMCGHFVTTAGAWGLLRIIWR
jgi:hypothetical protein